MRQLGDAGRPKIAEHCNRSVISRHFSDGLADIHSEHALTSNKNPRSWPFAWDSDFEHNLAQGSTDPLWFYLLEAEARCRAVAAELAGGFQWEETQNHSNEAVILYVSGGAMQQFQQMLKVKQNINDF